MAFSWALVVCGGEQSGVWDSGVLSLSLSAGHVGGCVNVSQTVHSHAHVF